MDGVPAWWMPCTDAMGRRRSLGISVTKQGNVALIAPAGESAIIGPDQVEQVRVLLSEARAISLRGAW